MRCRRNKQTKFSNAHFSLLGCLEKTSHEVEDIIGEVYKETVGRAQRPKRDQCLLIPCFVCRRQCFLWNECKCYIEMGFSHKNSKPLDQVQAKVIVRDFVIHNYNYQFLLFFRKFASGFDIYIS